MGSLLPPLRNRMSMPADEVQDAWRLADGNTVIIRAAKPDDGPLMQAMMARLSATSRYYRFRLCGFLVA